MVALVSDPSNVAFNCFCSLEWASDYMDSRLHTSVWDEATTADKTSALLWATLLLDSLSWIGARTVSTQNLAWPRDGAVHPDSGEELATTTVPAAVKNATAQLALELLTSDTVAPTGLEGFSKLKLDTIEIEVKASDRPNWLSRSVLVLCAALLSVASPINATPLRS